MYTGFGAYGEIESLIGHETVYDIKLISTAILGGLELIDCTM